MPYAAVPADLQDVALRAAKLSFRALPSPLQREQWVKAWVDVRNQLASLADVGPIHIEKVENSLKPKQRECSVRIERVGEVRIDLDNEQNKVVMRRYVSAGYAGAVIDVAVEYNPLTEAFEGQPFDEKTVPVPGTPKFPRSTGAAAVLEAAVTAIQEQAERDRR